jgi:para-nitrobenzyl esterase
MKRFSILIASLICAVAASAQNAQSPRARVANGVLQGYVDGGDVRVFAGIPYALPPVGQLRWHEPMPITNWSGVRAADHFGNRPMQPTLWKDMIFRSPEMSEDCLYLNVWAPFTGTNLPVLVYFHGGGLVAGDGSEPRYDGSAFARQGIVVVTINYRLGVFGFFAHPELTKESPHHASGNYGYLDQNAALRWVHANIAAFGGDPGKVTIGGQSAGSFSVSAQMVSLLARGLFQGAIAESGSLLGHRPTPSLAEGERAGADFAASLGAPTLAELRRIPADRLLATSRTNKAASLQTILDGYFLPEEPEEVFFTGRQADVPLLAGWTSAEVDYHSVLGDATPTPENFRAKVRELYGDRADTVLRLYPAGDAQETFRSATDLASDRFIAYRTWKLIDEAWKSGGQPVYRYLWGQIPPREKDAPAPASDAPPRQGASHSSELPYVFGALDRITAIEWTPADYQASAAIHGFFANFIRTGNPNGDGLPPWPWFQASSPKVMFIDAHPHTIPEPNLRRYQFLDQR